FNDADAVVVANVYEAGEDPIEGYDRDALVEGLGRHGHRTVLPLDDPKDLAGIIHGLAGPGDMVVCLGAGDITRWANDLPDELRRLGAQGREAANDDG
ncbi:MAG: UDP-N-acetylmuramate--L-alanine ligase, partial [Rhodospirillales bacterium]